MPNLRKLSWIDIALIIILVVGAVIAYSLSQANANVEQEKTRLETRVKAAEINLSEVEKEINLENLRQSLEKAQSALAENPLPNEADAVAVTSQLMQYAEESNITITSWDSSYTSISLKERNYSAISHSLSVEGKTDALIDFIEALPRASVAPAVQSMDISGVEGKKGTWQMRLELLVYYRQS